MCGCRVYVCTLHTSAHVYMYITFAHMHTHSDTRTQEVRVYYIYVSSIQVDYLDSSRNQAVLQMIPRVDYNRKRGHLRSHDGSEVPKTRRCPPQNLFDAQAIRYVSYVCILL